MATRLTALWHLYAVATAALAPAVAAWDRRTLTRKGAPVGRMSERLGRPSKDRPDGDVVWLHGVSIGEMRVAQAVARALQDMRPDTTMLITSASATSASAGVVPGLLHQMAPIDTPGAVRRFLNHWHPRLAVFTESDLWPRQIAQAHRRGIPLALINARLSPKSLDRWRAFPRTASALLSRFDVVAAQTQMTATALEQLGAPAPIVTGDLKRAAPSLPVDLALVRSLRELMEDAPIWVAASTHPGEDEPILRAHRHVLGRVPDARLILVPRHPHRGEEIAEIADSLTLTHRRRSDGGPEDAQVYIADTIGEMSLWFALARVAVMAGSFEPIGGHNPMEPAHAHLPILTGPHTENFGDVYPPLIAAGGAEQVEASDIGPRVTALLKDKKEAHRMGASAHHFAQTECHGVQRVALALAGLLRDG